MSRRSDRFQPSRAGIINVWDYVDEEFAFADGRLILRGHNGSGKTKALEVLFPFVLDGHTDARRLDPFSGQNRTMKSNLLYRGDESAYGYVWMEFARAPRETGNAPDTVTLVIGLRAHKHRDGVTPSFFVTDRRMGVDFGLLASDGRPLTERQLKAALGEHSHHTSAGDYRRAVDAALFGLGDRYVQLLDLLLALRRPLLAKDLDPEKVSETLTSGLSPVDEALVEQAARDFANLAAVQRRFDSATTAHEAARTFTAQYADYLTTNARHRLQRVDGAAQQAGEYAATVTESAAEHDRAVLAREQARTRVEELDGQLAEASARIKALEGDEALRDHATLRRRRENAETQGRQLAAQGARIDTQAQEVGHLRTEAERVAERIEHDHATARRLSGNLAETADRAGLTHDAEGPLDTGQDLPTSAHARAAARQDDVSAVRAQLDELETAESDRQRAETDSARARDALDEHELSCERAQTELTELRAGTADAVRAWHERWELAGNACLDALLESVERFGEPGTPALTEVLSEHAHHDQLRLAARAQSLQTEEAEAERELRRLRSEREDIAAERDDAPPDDPLRSAPRTDRQGAPLWELVRFAEGVDENEAAGIEGALQAAGLLTAWVHPDPDLTRAALQDPDSDAHLVPARTEHQGPTLAEVLVPEQQEHVPAEAVTAILRCLPYHRPAGHGSTADDDTSATGPAVIAGGGIDARSRFGSGVLVGAHPKPAAEFIGATNRAHRRRERLAECDRRLDELTAHHQNLSRDLARVRDQQKDHERARTDLPDPTPVARAVRAVEHRSTLVASARTTADDRRRELDTAVARVDAQRRRTRTAAAERAMPCDRTGVEAVAAAVTEFADTAKALHTARTDAAEYERDLTARRETIDRLTAGLEAEQTDLAQQRTAHEEELSELAALEEAIDAPVRDLLARLEETRAEHGALGRERAETHRTAETENEHAIRAETRREQGREALTLALGRLQDAVEGLAEFTQPGLRAVMGVEPATSWPDRSTWPTPEQAAQDILTGTAPAVHDTLPEEVAALLGSFTEALRGVAETGESDIKSAAGRMSQALRTFSEALGADAEGYRVDHEVGPTGIITVFVNDESGRSPVSAFTRSIADRVEEQGALLHEEERQVLEDELLGGIAQQIHDRVRGAKALVREMDRDTRARPMSSGTRIGIRWARSDGLNDRENLAAQLVKRDEAGLGPSGLAELRTVLRDLIRDHHAAHPRASYKQVLSAVLDYRDWYRFELRLAVPGQEEVKLTKNKHEQMSGGEKSAAIHLPLFAAANALYSSARATCPRVVALDEAFAGIDDRYKPELMGLTVTFDLDMFMTGHDLWVYYESVPMAAHYDMHHDKGAHTVSAMLLLWDGQQTVDADAGFAGNEELAAELLGLTPSRFVPQSTEGTLLAEAGRD
ncbi:TIGR02680 family protein [Nocardiopsis kunsanensis]|uniref:TIGR02680 family protein n=1 Tax=Nocardiopsis kunsanensis TaxID=141693 RepID=UPI000349D6C2|nr:TIGR02680 family protein [Nocardiopsis kunsanensis]